MLDAATPLPALPAHVRLRDTDLPFWDGIVRARARDEWSASDLVVAAQLARCQYDIERESIVLDDEGTVLVNERGTQIANPRVSVLEQLARREMALLRTLRMGGTAAGGDRRDLEKGRLVQRQSERMREELASDDLIAR
jgi:hypothetical protein